MKNTVEDLLSKTFIGHAFVMQILGFFFAGVVLNQFGLIRNLIDVKVLSEWGILFLVRSIYSA